MENRDRIVALLKYTSLGRDLSETDIQKLLEVGTVCDADTGHLLCVEGTPSDSLCVLLNGEAELLKNDATGNPLLLGKISQGETIGELGFVLNYPRLGSVRTTCPSLIFVLHRTEFDRLFSTSRVGVKLALRLCELAHRHLGHLVEKNDRFVRDYGDALTSLDRLRTAPPDTDTRPLRDTLTLEIDRLREQHHQLQQQLYPVHQPQKPKRRPNRKLQIALGSILGLGAIAGILYLIFEIDRLREEASEPPYPAVLPDISDATQCTGDGRYWYDEQCFDFSQ
ncbi:hypothetical protein AY599_16650 [Leptolyngbya valderiana BDU 20041]|nr:cyclic nucleotide-binding domain-containing protein [Geitlerinema sp. CS-897]OAB63345.1 hypothetical protein AY599_16650 [Leptolyngbya valderiana BDU 20041]